jgi:tetrahydromethanopterin S-methyltransferase subunit G
MKEQYEELHQYFETIDKKISIYHLKIGDLKMNEKSEKLPKLEKKFNNIFKETADMYYKIGKENGLIY